MVRNLEPLPFTLTGLISASRRESGRRRGQTQAQFDTIFYITESKFIFLQALATQSLFATTWNGLFKTCPKRCHLRAEIIATEALAACPHLPGLAQAPTPACRGRRRSRSWRRYRETMAVVAGVLTLAPTRWGRSRPSRTTGEMSMPRVAGVRALRCSSHRSPSTNVLIFPQLTPRISGPATTHAKLTSSRPNGSGRALNQIWRIGSTACCRSS